MAIGNLSERLERIQQLNDKGLKHAAAQLARLIVEEDAANFDGWLWLARTTNNPEEKAKALQRAGDLRPGDPALQELQGGTPSATAPAFNPLVNPYAPPSYSPPQATAQPASAPAGGYMPPTYNPPQPQPQSQPNAGGYNQPQPQPQPNAGGFNQPQPQSQPNAGGYNPPQPQPNSGGYLPPVYNPPNYNPPQPNVAPQPNYGNPAPPPNNAGNAHGGQQQSGTLPPLAFGGHNATSQPDSYDYLRNLSSTTTPPPGMMPNPYAPGRVAPDATVKKSNPLGVFLGLLLVLLSLIAGIWWAINLLGFNGDVSQATSTIEGQIIRLSESSVTATALDGSNKTYDINKNFYDGIVPLVSDPKNNKQLTSNKVTLAVSPGGRLVRADVATPSKGSVSNFNSSSGLLGFGPVADWALVALAALLALLGLTLIGRGGKNNLSSPKK